jgi:hypothetical protein
MRPETALEIRVQVQRFVTRDPAAALRKARQEYLKGREQTRLAKNHRRLAQRSMFVFDEFRRNLEAIGVRVIIETQANPNTNALGGTSGNSSKTGGQA